MTSEKIGKAIRMLVSESHAIGAGAGSTMLLGECRKTLDDLITAALADARREGAEAMREAAQAAPSGIDERGIPTVTVWQIRALPLPTGPRQTVLLTDKQIENGRKQVFSTDNPFCPCDAKTMRKAARWAEAAALAANGLEVRDWRALRKRKPYRPRKLGTCVTGNPACDDCLLGDGFCRKEVSR